MCQVLEPGANNHLRRDIVLCKIFANKFRGLLCLEIFVKKKPSLSHPIVETLRWRILRWEYPPHYPLNEEMLCQEFGVSRSPVREALKALEAGGFVERRKNRTYVVKQVRGSDLEELYDFRLALELYSLDILVRTPEWHDKVRQLREEWENQDLESLDNLDNQKLALVDQHFHETLLALTGKRIFLEELRKLNERLFVFRMMDFDQPSRVESTRAQHLAILDAVLAGDKQRAREALSCNVLDGRNNVSKGFAEVLANSYERVEGFGKGN